jgi:hypothetical protein
MQRPTETREQLIARRRREIYIGVMEGVRKEVEWLERHNFAVWILHEGQVVDARTLPPEQRTAAPETLDFGWLDGPERP